VYVSTTLFHPKGQLGQRGVVQGSQGVPRGDDREEGQPAARPRIGVEQGRESHMRSVLHAQSGGSMGPS